VQSNDIFARNSTFQRRCCGLKYIPELILRFLGPIGMRLPHGSYYKKRAKTTCYYFVGSKRKKQKNKKISISVIYFRILLFSLWSGVKDNWRSLQRP